MEGRRAVLLANHGILAGAQNLLNAFNIVEEVEYWLLKIYCLAKILESQQFFLMRSGIDGRKNLKQSEKMGGRDINVTNTEKYFSRFIERL